MRLEQQFYEVPRISEPRQQVYFIVGDLEGLSATALYMSKKGACPEYNKYVEETWREDSDGKVGDHINYEVWLKQTGHKEGRQIKLSNAHIFISPANESVS